jgi:hypothetical protein
MSEITKVVIVLMRCHEAKRGSGIRFEELRPGNWAATWVFGISDNQAKKEGYDKGYIKGEIMFADTYPGCPYCHSPSIVKCGKCSKVSCWDGEYSYISCAWCGQKSRISGNIHQLDTRVDG